MNKNNAKNLSQPEMRSYRFKGLGGHQVIIHNKSYDVFFNDYNNFIFTTDSAEIAEALRKRGFIEVL